MLGRRPCVLELLHAFLERLLFCRHLLVSLLEVLLRLQSIVLGRRFRILKFLHTLLELFPFSRKIGPRLIQSSAISGDLLLSQLEIIKLPLDIRLFLGLFFLCIFFRSPVIVCSRHQSLPAV